MRFWRSCPFRNRPGLVSAPGLRWLLVPAFRLPKLQSLNTFNFGFDCDFQAFVAIGDYNGHVGLGVKCSKEVATAIRGAIILAKLSIIPVRRGYWGNKIGKPHTVPCKVRCLKFELYFAVVKILTDVFINWISVFVRWPVVVVQSWCVSFPPPVVLVSCPLPCPRNCWWWLVLMTATPQPGDVPLPWATLVRGLCEFQT